jgi:hypothetical protein
MPQSSYPAVRGFIYPLLFCLLLGCATTKPASVKLARRYYGTWENVNPRYFNWWVIGARGAENYGIALDGGKCGARAAIVTSSTSIEVPFGNSGADTLHVVEGDFLLFMSPHGFALHKRVSPSAICRKANGSYFEGAPSAPTIGPALSDSASP